MLNWLLTFSLKNRFPIIGATLAIAGVGLWAMTHIPFDAYPDLTGIRVEVITEAPGLAPEEVEQLVTYPLESALMGLQGAENVRSVSKYGLSVITVRSEERRVGQARNCG